MIAMGIALGVIIGLNATVLVWVKMRSDAIDAKIEGVRRLIEGVEVLFGGEESSSASSEGEDAN